MNNKTILLIVSLGGALIYWIAMVFMAMITEPLAGQADSTMYRIFTMLGGSFPSGFIQMLTMLFFLYGLLVLLSHRRQINQEGEAFKMNLLPTAGERVLKPEQVLEIKLKMVELEKEGYTHQLIGLIKKTCTQYRNDGLVSDTLQVMEAQAHTLREKSESEYGIINYISPAIASIGFLGTVLGIAAAIGDFHLAGTDEGLRIITHSLYIAFDTTFVALALGLVFNYYFNKVQEEERRLFAAMKSYIIDNLISRIYHGGVKAEQMM